MNNDEYIFKICELVSQLHDDFILKRIYLFIVCLTGED